MQEITTLLNNIQHPQAGTALSTRGARDSRPATADLPPLLIGGVNALTLKAPSCSVNIDWLAVSLKNDNLALSMSMNWVYNNLIKHFPEIMKRNAKIQECKGRNGYTFGIGYYLGGEEAGGIFWGGDNQRGTVFFEMKGKICSLFSPDRWRLLYRFLRLYKFRLTRTDLCADFFQGQLCVRCLYDSCQKDLRGVLSLPDVPSRGILPRVQWIDSGSAGATVTIGSRDSARQIVAYEKGKKNKDVSSPWNRLEVRWFRLAKRFEISYEVLNPDMWLDLLRGCGQWFGRLFPEGIAKKFNHLRTEKTEDLLQTVIASIAHVRKNYGKFIWWLNQFAGEYLAMQILADSSGTWRKIEKHPQLDSKQSEELLSIVLHELADRAICLNYSTRERFEQ